MSTRTSDLSAAPPGAHWLLGNAREMAAAPHHFPAELGWRGGGLARFRLLRQPFTVVTDADAARRVLITHHDRYARSFHYRTGRVVIGDGLLSTDGPAWLTRRKQMLPAFHATTLQAVFDATTCCTQEMLARWQEFQNRGESVPLVAEMQRTTLAVIARALLSTAVSESDARRFGQAVRDSLRLVRRRNTSIARAPLWMPTGANRKLHATRRVLDEYVNRHLQARAGGEERADILNALLQVRDENEAPLSAQALLDETKTLFVAGFETTATALTWTLYLLARHPQIAQRWHEETSAVLGDRAPTLADLDELIYTKQIAKEALRLYPPVYNLGRECVQPDTLGEYSLRPGEAVLISVYGIHRSPQWWSEPQEFRPERFAPDASWPRHAWLPFAAGKHVCIGASFSLTEMTAALALIGRRFRLALEDEAPVGELAQITLVPSREIGLRLTPL